MGGPVWLVVSEPLPEPVDVTVNGGVAMAVFDHGVTDPATFEVVPGAPQAVLQAEGQIRLVVSAEAAAAADPAAVLDFWTGFVASHADLAQEPEFRSHASHWLFDPQVGFGYANATAARIAYPSLAEAMALRQIPDDEVDWWLFGHELGHQFQTSDWRGGDVTEVCVNLWTMYTLNTYLEGGDDFGTSSPVRADGPRVARRHAVGRGRSVRQVAALPATRRRLRLDHHSRGHGQLLRPRLPTRDLRQLHGWVRAADLVHRGAGHHTLPRPLEYPYSTGARDQILAWQLDPWLPPGW